MKPTDEISSPPHYQGRARPGHSDAGRTHVDRHVRTYRSVRRPGQYLPGLSTTAGLYQCGGVGGGARPCPTARLPRRRRPIAVSQATRTHIQTCPTSPWFPATRNQVPDNPYQRRTAVLRAGRRQCCPGEADGEGSALLRQPAGGAAGYAHGYGDGLRPGRQCRTLQRRHHPRHNRFDDPAGRHNRVQRDQAGMRLKRRADAVA